MKLIKILLKSVQMRSLAEGIGLTVVWFAAIFASISIHHFAFADTHSICGPWGCGPSNGALIAVHVGWLTAIWPPLLYFPWRFGWNYLFCQRLGFVLASIGFAGMLGIIAWQWFVWLPQAGEYSRSFLWQRCGFAIATAVDLPSVQLIGIGTVLAAMNRTRRVQRTEC